MAQGRPKQVIEEVEGWEGPAPVLDPAGIVSVLIVVPRLPIKGELPAIALTAPNVAQR